MHFGLDSLNELPGVDELRSAGLLDLAPIAFAETAAVPETEDDCERVIDPRRAHRVALGPMLPISAPSDIIARLRMLLSSNQDRSGALRCFLTSACRS